MKRGEKDEGWVNGWQWLPEQRGDAESAHGGGGVKQGESKRREGKPEQHILCWGKLIRGLRTREGGKNRGKNLSSREKA